MPHDVVLISNDASLASMVHTVIPMPGTLRILRSSTELPAAHEFGAETVVLDLPADIRLAARAEVRKRYSGRLLVALSSEAEAEGWPDDPACRFLVRPFRVDEVVDALRAPVPPAGKAATRPGTAEIAAAAAPRMLGSSRRRGPLAVLLVLAVAAAVGGVAIGRASVSLEDRSASARAALPQGVSVAPPPAAPPSTATRQSQSAACVDAIDQADAAIAYLVAGIHDDRLSRTIQQFRDDRLACRGKAGP